MIPVHYRWSEESETIWDGQTFAVRHFPKGSPRGGQFMPLSGGKAGQMDDDGILERHERNAKSLKDHFTGMDVNLNSIQRGLRVDGRLPDESRPLHQSIQRLRGQTRNAEHASRDLEFLVNDQKHHRYESIVDHEDRYKKMIEYIKVVIHDEGRTDLHGEGSRMETGGILHWVERVNSVAAGLDHDIIHGARGGEAGHNWQLFNQHLGHIRVAIDEFSDGTREFAIRHYPSGSPRGGQFMPTSGGKVGQAADDSPLERHERNAKSLKDHFEGMNNTVHAIRRTLSEETRGQPGSRLIGIVSDEHKPLYQALTKLRVSIHEAESRAVGLEWAVKEERRIGFSKDVNHEDTYRHYIQSIKEFIHEEGHTRTNSSGRPLETGGILHWVERVNSVAAGLDHDLIHGERGGQAGHNWQLFNQHLGHIRVAVDEFSDGTREFAIRHYPKGSPRGGQFMPLNGGKAGQTGNDDKLVEEDVARTQRNAQSLITHYEGAQEGVAHIRDGLVDKDATANDPSGIHVVAPEHDDLYAGLHTLESTLFDSAQQLKEMQEHFHAWDTTKSVYEYERDYTLGYLKESHFASGDWSVKSLIKMVEDEAVLSGHDLARGVRGGEDGARWMIIKQHIRHVEAALREYDEETRQFAWDPVAFAIRHYPKGSPRGGQFMPASGSKVGQLADDADERPTEDDVNRTDRNLKSLQSHYNNAGEGVTTIIGKLMSDDPDRTDIPKDSSHLKLINALSDVEDHCMDAEGVTHAGLSTIWRIHQTPWGTNTHLHMARQETLSQLQKFHSDSSGFPHLMRKVEEEAAKVDHDIVHGVRGGEDGNSWLLIREHLRHASSAVDEFSNEDREFSWDPTTQSFAVRHYPKGSARGGQFMPASGGKAGQTVDDADETPAQRRLRHTEYLHSEIGKSASAVHELRNRLVDHSKMSVMDIGITHLFREQDKPLWEALYDVGHSLVAAQYEVGNIRVAVHHENASSPENVEYPQRYRREALGRINELFQGGNGRPGIWDKVKTVDTEAARVDHDIAHGVRGGVHGNEWMQIKQHLRHVEAGTKNWEDNPDEFAETRHYPAGSPRGGQFMPNSGGKAGAPGDEEESDADRRTRTAESIKEHVHRVNTAVSELRNDLVDNTKPALHNIKSEERALWSALQKLGGSNGGLQNMYYNADNIIWAVKDENAGRTGPNGVDPKQFRVEALKRISDHFKTGTDTIPDMVARVETEAAKVDHDIAHGVRGGETGNKWLLVKEHLQRIESFVDDFSDGIREFAVRHFPKGSPRGGQFMPSDGGKAGAPDYSRSIAGGIGLRVHENVMPIARQHFGSDVTPLQLARLGGALPGQEVQISAAQMGDRIGVSIQNVYGSKPHVSADRIILGPHRISNDSLHIEPSGGGTGLRMFATQVKQAQLLGIRQIVTVAAGSINSRGYNGYYTWPRMGYDSGFAAWSNHYPSKKLPSELGKPRRILDLYETPQGREWWKQNGSELMMTFDVRTGSRSQNVLHDYLREKNSSASFAETKHYGHVRKAIYDFDDGTREFSVRHYPKGSPRGGQFMPASGGQAGSYERAKEEITKIGEFLGQTSGGAFYKVPDHARFWEQPDVIRPGAPRQCYANALKTLRRDKNADLGIGLLFMNNYGLPLQHAWIVKQDKLHEVTLTRDLAKDNHYVGVVVKREVALRDFGTPDKLERALMFGLNGRPTPLFDAENSASTAGSSRQFAIRHYPKGSPRGGQFMPGDSGKAGSNTLSQYLLWGIAQQDVGGASGGYMGDRLTSRDLHDSLRNMDFQQDHNNVYYHRGADIQVFEGVNSGKVWAITGMRAGDPQIHELGDGPDHSLDAKFDRAMTEHHQTGGMNIMAHRVGMANISRMAGRPVSVLQAARLGGASPGARVNITPLSGTSARGSRISYSDHNDETFASRYISASYPKEIHNSSFSVASSHAARGYGARATATQVKQANLLGFEKLTTFGAGNGSDTRNNPGHNVSGYYAWPRLGFNATLSSLNVRAPFFGAETVLDVMATPSGRDWWKNFGEGGAYEFDLRSGSRSMNVHHDYLREARRYASFAESDLDVVKWDGSIREFAIRHYPKGSPRGGQFMPANGGHAGTISDDHLYPELHDQLISHGFQVNRRNTDVPGWRGYRYTMPDRSSATHYVDIRDDGSIAWAAGWRDAHGGHEGFAPRDTSNEERQAEVSEAARRIRENTPEVIAARVQSIQENQRQRSRNSQLASQILANRMDPNHPSYDPTHPDVVDFLQGGVIRHPTVPQSPRITEVHEGVTIHHNEEVMDRARDIFGNNVGPLEIARLGGALPGHTVEIGIGAVSHDILLDITGTRPSVRGERAIQGSAVIGNSLLRINPTSTGTGTTMFATQVKQARLLGMVRIDVKAAGRPGGSANGYYTWPRLGYDADIRMYTEGVSVPPTFRGIRTIQDLFRLPGGMEWWKANGSSMRMSFDVRPNSVSNRVLNAYLDETGRSAAFAEPDPPTRNSKVIWNNGEFS